MCVLLRVTRLMTNVLEMTEEVLQPCYYNTKLADIFKRVHGMYFIRMQE